MKTTLNMDPVLVERLKAEAAKKGFTISELVESAVRLWWQVPASNASADGGSLQQGA